MILWWGRFFEFNLYWFFLWLICHFPLSQFIMALREENSLQEADNEKLIRELNKLKEDFAQMQQEEEERLGQVAEAYEQRLNRVKAAYENAEKAAKQLQKQLDTSYKTFPRDAKRQIEEQENTIEILKSQLEEMEVRQDEQLFRDTEAYAERLASTINECNPMYPEPSRYYDENSSRYYDENSTSRFSLDD